MIFKYLLLYNFLLFLRKLLISCLIGILLLSGKSIAAQETGDPKEDFLYGEFYISKGRFQEALPFYLSALKNDSDNCNLNYRVGLCYSKLDGEQQLALIYLKKAILDVIPNYVEGKYKSNGSPYESWLLLGDAYHRANEFYLASYAYHKYLELIGNSDEDRVLMIKNKIDGLGINYEFQRSENNNRLVNLGGNINTRFSDYNPVFNGDQSVLIYTQYWESSDRIMMSIKTENRWSVPVEITEQLGSDGDCYTSSLSYDGKELFLIRFGDNNYDIYVSEFNNGEWSKIQPVSGKINSNRQESSVCISADGNYLYFSSNRSGGVGGFDLYTARRNGMNWVDIKNLGKNINTPKNEEWPYISYDSTTLYFSSDGHESIGKMDIFYAELDSNGRWQRPQNMGIPINTPNNDLFYIFFKNTQTGYLSRELSDGFGKKDIYIKVNEYSIDIPVGSVQMDNLEGVTLNTQTYPDNSSLNSSNSFNGDSAIISGKDLYTLPIYTIQVLALKRPLRASRKKDLSLTESAGNDGFHRYTINEFQGWSAAVSKLDSIRGKGYPDAFIRNINTIPNYSKTKDVRKEGQK